MAESVEEFLARGGKINAVPAGRRTRKPASRPAAYAVWDDFTQSWQTGAFPDRKEAVMAAAACSGNIEVRPAPRGMEWDESSSVSAD